MSDTSRLKLPLMAAGQAQKHVTHNEALEVLDAVVQIGVVSVSLASPPPGPAAGARYVVASGGTGAWAGRDGQIARWDGAAWLFHAPQPGWIAVAEDTASLYARIGSTWTDLADFVWTVRTAGSARARLNKAAPSDTGSLIFQTGFSGRAEMGLTGSDDFAVKVSADGTAWTQALSVDRTTGRVNFDQGAERVQVDTFTANGTWTKPAWARRVTAILVGGGGGGGSGRRGAAGSERRSGGGGGAGGFSVETWPADELPATLSIDVGAGGSGGAARTVNDTNGADGTPGTGTVLRDGSLNLPAAGGGGRGAGGLAVAGGGAAGGTGTGGPANSGAAPNPGGGGAGTETGLGLGAGGGGAGGGLSTANVQTSGGRGGHGYMAAGGGSRQAAGGAGGAGGLGGFDGAAKGWARGAGAGGGGG
uniref:DUF2793 domain-containing protein n=1 Tax=Chthonobacter albigriseus TaxID=1683161 RepID=UPI0015EF0B81